MSRLIQQCIWNAEPEFKRMLPAGFLQLYQRIEQRQALSLDKIISDTIGFGDLISDPEYRGILFSSLDERNAQRLVTYLGLSGRNPWSTLAESVKGRKPKQLRSICEFFDVETPVQRHEVRSFEIAKIDPEYCLFPHQREVANQMLNVMHAHGRTMVHMPTGSGKTRTAVTAICEFLNRPDKQGKSVIWLADRQELCVQAYDEFHKAWRKLGNRPVNLQAHWGSNIADFQADGTNICVMTLQSLGTITSGRHLTDFSKFRRNVELVIFDEAHKAMAETYSDSVNYVSVGNVAVIGLSATPGRSTLNRDEDRQLVEFFNKQKIDLHVEGYSNPIEYLKDQGYLAAPQFERLTFEGWNEEINQTLDGGKPTQETARQMALNWERNKLIVERLFEAAKVGHSIIFFGCNLEHCNLISTTLVALGVRSCVVDHRLDPGSRQSAINSFVNEEVQIICNYDLLTAGFDAPKTDMVFISRPTSSAINFSQMVGRGLRGPKAKGTETCRIVTLVDAAYAFRQEVEEQFLHWEDVWDENYVGETL